MKMRFQHPTNGYIEDTSHQWLWALLFGPLYFASKGIWTTAIIEVLLCLLLFGLPWMVYPILADRIVYEHYMNRGWKQIKA